MKKAIVNVSVILILLFILSACKKKNNPPTIDDQNFTLNENSEVGTMAGTVVAADEEDMELTYSIVSGNTNDAFSISQKSGVITVKTKTALDFEVTPEFTLKIEVKDSKLKGSVADVIIKLNNIQIVVADQSFSINENSLNGELVGQIAAQQQFTYSITDGNINNAFEITPTDSKIIVHNTSALDFEANPVFNLTVEASDINNEKGITHITVNLNDLVIPTNGLLLYMPFDGSVNDLSPTSNNGIDFTSHNYVAGKKAQALDFNGLSDYVRLSQTINSQNGLSFSFWINTRGANGAQNNGSVISKYSKNNETRCFMVWSFGAYETRGDNRLAAAFYAYGSSSAYHDMTKSYLEPSELLVYPTPTMWSVLNPVRLVTGEWTHCIVNLTPTTIEIWINDKICTKKTREYTSYSTSSNEPVLIGNNYDIGEGTNNHFNGQLDEFRIYNRALTNLDIQTLFKE